MPRSFPICISGELTASDLNALINDIPAPALLFDIKNKIQDKSQAASCESPSTASLSSTDSLSPVSGLDEDFAWWPEVETSSISSLGEAATTVTQGCCLGNQFISALTDDVLDPWNTFAFLKFSAHFKDGYRSAYSQWDQNLMSLEATTLVNTIRPNQDEAHRERLTSGQGKCQSFGGVVPLKPKQECVAQAVSL